MKLLWIALTSVFVIVVGVIPPAHADNSYDYWPEYGTFAYQNSWAYRNVNADKVQALGATGAGIKVAVLDDGLSASDPTLRSKVVAYKDFVPGTKPDEEHGSMVASTVASDFRSEVGIGGIAPGVSLIVARVCVHGGCYQDAARNAISWAIDQGADVVTESFTGYPDPLMHATYINAVKRGVVVVTAMGNGGCTPYRFNNLNPGCVQGAVREYTQGNYPLAGLIAVSASGRDDSFVNTEGWGSSFGPNTDIMAPGYETSAYDAFAASNAFGGTSAATPIVAGVAALILSVKPDLTPAQVQAIIQSTATEPANKKHKVWDSCSRNTSGVWECVNIVDSTFPQQYFTGAGIVDAEAAVKLTKLWASNTLLSEPTLSQSDQVVTITWNGGPADVYINSKLQASKVSSGYTYSGYLNQSVAVEIRQNGLFSKPALILVTAQGTQQQPIIQSINLSSFSESDEFNLTVAGANIDPGVYTTNDWGRLDYPFISAIFEEDDGSSFPCVGQKQTYDPYPFYFRCYITTMGRFQISGTLSFVGKDSKLGPKSNPISGQTVPPKNKIPITTEYPDSGQPSFSWSPVVGAASYEYFYTSDTNDNYLPGYGMSNWKSSCTTSTSASPSDVLAIQPGVFRLVAYDGEGCSGAKLGFSESIQFRVLPPKPPKPVGITVVNAGVDFIEFSVPNLDPNSYWKVYRSDGAMFRFFPGQRFIFPIQANEDVNGLSFSYRFVQSRQSLWATAWSEMSDPVLASFAPVGPLFVQCFNSSKKFEVKCGSNSLNGTPKTRIEYLDSDNTVIKAVEYENTWPDRPRFRIENVPGAVNVRVAATVGVEGSRDIRYRRGEARIYPISPRMKQGSLAQAR